MGYQGRIIYICNKGHVLQRDCYVDEYGERPADCPFCNTPYTVVGTVDDTNGNSVAGFKLNCLEKEEKTIKYEDGVMTLKLKPARYSVERTSKFVNFDTGEVLEFLL